MLFRTGTVVPFDKPDGGIRPVVIAPSFRRLVSKIVAKRMNDRLRPKFSANRQYCLMKDGVTQLVLTHKILLADPEYGPGKCLTTFDAKNAFNSVSRRAVLKSVAKAVPEASRFVDTLYGGATTILYRSSEGIQRIQMEEGTLQGCAASVPLYSLVQTDALEQADLSDSGVICSQYHDNCYLLGEPGDCAKALLDKIIPAFREVNLDLQPRASHVWSPQFEGDSDFTRKCVDAFRDFDGGNVVVTDSPGLLVLGVPLSYDPTFISDEVSRVAQAARSIAARARQLNDPQGHERILRLSVLARLTHLLRALSPSEGASAQLERFDEWMLQEFALMVSAELPVEADRLKWIHQRIRLPISLGGCGFRSLAAAHPAAFAAALLSTSVGLDRNTFRVLVAREDVPNPLLTAGAEAWALAAQRAGYTGPTMKLGGSGVDGVLDFYSLLGLEAGKGFRLSSLERPIAVQLEKALRLKLQQEAPEMAAHLLSSQGQGSSEWLNGPLFHPYARLEATAFCAAMGIRLGVQVAALSSVVQPHTHECPLCGHAWSYLHPLKCTKTGITTRRHDCIKKAVADMYASAGFSCGLERPLSQDGDRRIDILAVGMPSTEGRVSTMGVDVTMVAPYSLSGGSSSLNHAANTAGYATDAAAQAKHRHYDDPLLRACGASAQVVGFAMEYSGRLCTEAAKAIGVCAQSSTQAQLFGEASVFKAQWRSHLSCLAAKVLALTIAIFRSRSMPRWKNPAVFDAVMAQDNL
jgi:hypothetical protein